MSLTGATFQWLTIIAAIGVTVGIVLVWNRIRGPRPVRILSRVMMLAAGYTLSAIAVLVSINIAYGGLIATWGDLFDNLSAHSVASPGGGNGGPGHGHFGHPPGGRHPGDGHFGPPGGRPSGAPRPSPSASP